MIKDITIHPVRSIERDVFSRTSSSAASANISGIAFSYRCNIVQTLYGQFITIARRRILQSSSGKRVAIINTSAFQETQWQWRNPEQ